jgi:truncated hemoglobin YjbI
MGLCASTPEVAAEKAPPPSSGAPKRPPSAHDDEAHDTVGVELAAAAGPVFAADGLQPAPSGLLRKEQSVVGALPTFVKSPSDGSRRGVPLSDLPRPPPSPSAARAAGLGPPPFAPPPPLAAAAAAGNSGSSSGVAAATAAEDDAARRSKGYDPLERPSRSALRNAADGDGAATPRASGGAPAAAGEGAAPAAAAAGASPPRKSLDASVKFRGLPPPADGAGAGAAAAAAAATAADGAAVPPPPRSIDAETADPERRARLDAVSKTFSMRKVVDSFYERVMSDPELRPFFERVDAEKLKRHQEAAFALAFGGQELLVSLEGGAAGGAPPSDLRTIHRRQIAEHGLGVAHFDAFLRLFAETVDAIPAIPQEQRRVALAQLRAARPMFEPLSDAERAQLQKTEGAAAAAAAGQQQQQQQQQARSSGGGGGGGRRRFLLFGPRVGGSRGGGGVSDGGGGAAGAAAAAREGAAASAAPSTKEISALAAAP